MFARPHLVIFDVNETLFSLEKLRPRLRNAGLDAGTLELWFSQTLRDGLALSACQAPRPFMEVAEAALRVLLAQRGIEASEARVRSVLGAFGELDPQPEAREALALLRDADVRLVTLTQGGAANTERLLARADLDGLVERCFSVEEVGPWKPFAEPYRHVLERCGVEAQDAALVSVHGWDIAGATACGLATAWVSRLEKRASFVMPPATVVGPDLVIASRQLARARPGRTELPASVH